MKLVALISALLLTFSTVAATAYVPARTEFETPWWDHQEEQDPNQGCDPMEVIEHKGECVPPEYEEDNEDYDRHHEDHEYGWGQGYPENPYEVGKKH